jgi:pimeloyl-ACP methyl ester carboxylesterase
MAAMAIAEVGGAQISYERSGSGEPLLLIMGMSGTARHWGDPFLDALRRDFDVIVFDHRGVGASTPLAGLITISEMARDATGLLDSLGIESAHVAGVSMGGMIAQELALAHPEQVRTLTLGCTYCGGAGSALAAPDVIQRLTEAFMSGDRERALEAGWEVNVSPATAADSASKQRFLETGRANAVAATVVMAQMQAVMGHDTSARLPQLDAPTLVIHGTVDQMLPVENGRLIASLIPGSRLEILDDIGHMFWWERPEQAAGLISARAGVTV